MKALRSVSPTVWLVGLGLFTTAIYATFVYLFPFNVPAGTTKAFDFEKLSRGREWAAVFYAVGILAAFAALAAAFFVVQRSRRPVLTVAGFGLLNALILVGLYPITAIDVFYYVLQGRQEVIYHLNPLAVAAAKIGSDPLLNFVGEWKNIPSPYGPIWGVISAAVVRLGLADPGNGPLAFKLIAVAAFAICMAVVLWGTGRNVQALLLLAWNPLVLLQGPGNAHNDLLMITIAALALVLWNKRRWWGAAVVVLALAASVKAPALLLAPLLVLDIVRQQAGWGRRIWVALAVAVLGVGTLALTYCLYWPPLASLAGLQQVTSGNQFNFTLVTLAGMSIDRMPTLAMNGLNTARVAGQVIFVAGYILLLWGLWTRRIQLYTAGFWAFFLYLLTATTYRIWYPLWVVPLGALAHAELIGDAVALARMRWRTFLISLTSEASALAFTLVWRWVFNGTVAFKADWYWMHVLVVPWQFGLPLLAPLLIRRKRKVAAESEAADPGGFAQAELVADPAEN